MTTICLTEESAFCGINYSVALLGLRQEGSSEAWTYHVSITSRDGSEAAESFKAAGLFEDLSIAEHEAHARARCLIEARAVAIPA